MKGNVNQVVGTSAYQAPTVSAGLAGGSGGQRKGRMPVGDGGVKGDGYYHNKNRISRLGHRQQGPLY